MIEDIQRAKVSGQLLFVCLLVVPQKSSNQPQSQLFHWKLSVTADCNDAVCMTSKKIFKN